MLTIADMLRIYKDNNYSCQDVKTITEDYCKSLHEEQKQTWMDIAKHGAMQAIDVGAKVAPLLLLEKDYVFAFDQS